MSTETLIGLMVVVPIAAAGLVLGLRRRTELRDIVTLAVLTAETGLASWLLARTIADGTTAVRLGGWAPDLGIVLVADLFAALVLVVAVGTILVVELFALGQRRTPWGADPELAGPLLLVLTGGVALSMLTGDLFTLFVAFELILVASYVLLTHRGERGQIRSGMTYVVMNLFASALFLIGVAVVYRSTGTVNMALLSERLGDLDDPLRIGIGLWFMVVFGTKAAAFPLFSWLPDSYPTAPTTVTAVFAGLLTKVGVYVLVRFHTLTGMDALQPAFLIVAGATMFIGVAGALAQNDVKRILSFHIVSQIGYMLMGLGLFSVAGIAGTVIFFVHHIPVKTVLFLTGGLIEEETGSSRLATNGGLAAKRPWLAVLFAIPALSLAGLPPFSGFIAKFALIDAGIDQSATPIVVIALIVSALTLLSMVKIWMAVFWGSPVDEADQIDRPGESRRRLLVGATTIGVAATLVVASLAGPLWDLSERAAGELLEPTEYIDASLGTVAP